MNNEYKEIVIAGGGVPALCLSLILSKNGIKSTIIEPFKPSKPENTKITGRTVALWQSSLNVLREAGIFESIENISGALKIMQIIDDSHFPHGSMFEVQFFAHEIDLDAFGYNIPAAPLLSFAADIADKDKNIDIIYGASVADIVGNFIELDNGEKIKANLIIGADGRNSKVRKAKGIDVKRCEYGQSAITCLIEHSKSHNNISTEFHRNGGPFTIVPLKGNISSIVWMENSEEAEKFISMNKHDFIQNLQIRTRNLVGEVSLKTNPELFPIIGLKANRIIADKTALIAEAAHVISPIGAQGMNLSLRDVAELSKIIIEAKKLGLDISSGSVLSKYERKRKNDINSRFAMIDGLNRIVSNNLESARGLRRFGLKAISTIPILKRKVMIEGLAP